MILCSSGFSSFAMAAVSSCARPSQAWLCRISISSQHSGTVLSSCVAEARGTFSSAEVYGVVPASASSGLGCVDDSESEPVAAVKRSCHATQIQSDAPSIPVRNKGVGVAETKKLVDPRAMNTSRSDRRRSRGGVHDSARGWFAIGIYRNKHLSNHGTLSIIL